MGAPTRPQNYTVELFWNNNFDSLTPRTNNSSVCWFTHDFCRLYPKVEKILKPPNISHIQSIYIIFCTWLIIIANIHLSIFK